MAEKRPTPVKPLTIYFYHTRLTRESYEEWKDYKFPGHILYGLPLLEKDVKGLSLGLTTVIW